MILLDEVLAASPCSIELPAGAGKTEMIARLAGQASARGGRLLVLTHTHAGVDALRRRLKKLDVSRSHYSVRTLDSWCFDLIGSYPLLSGIEVEREPDWARTAEYHMAGTRAVSSKAIQRMLRVSYELLIVDEYQDCQSWQHELIVEASKHIPTLVLGDRMQGLFFFGLSQPVLWERDVLSAFTNLPHTPYPWRWHARNQELGEWLLDARCKLLGGESLQLAGAPLRVVSPAEVVMVARDLPPHPERSVVLRRWPSDCAVLSASLGAGFTMIEELEGRHLLAFADLIDLGGPEVAEGVVAFAVSCAFGVAPVFSAERRRALRSPTPSRLSPHTFPEYAGQVQALNRLLVDQSREAVLAALLSLRQLPRFGLHRREAWLGVLDAVRLACVNRELTVRECVVATRNRLRMRGRYPESRVIARPLLIKGLEFDHAILAETAGLNAHELYVCLTRGSKSLTVASESTHISAKRPTMYD
jgi:hypothetical protein